ncbi:MAG: hypothetical protein ACIAXF_03570 [Phycisphaerales bacterium JB063]
MKRTTCFSGLALMVGALLLLGGCSYDSASYQYDVGPGEYHTGYVITETPKRTRAPRHYTTGYSTGYNVGYHTGYRSGGTYISVGHTTHYGHGGYHSGYHHGGYHRSHYSHRPHYSHRHYGHHRGGHGHGHGYIHFGTGYGGYHCD